MKTLDDAWEWYTTTRKQLHLMQRLAGRYWNELPEIILARDNEFRSLDGRELQEGSDFSLEHLDDFAIVVLFSVFESMVREHILREMALEEGQIKHRVLKRAADEAREKIERGSFFHVLEAFKDFHADLVAQVDQVRVYRNWVAHGRKGPVRNNVVPKKAYERLKQFLNVLSEAASGPTN